MSSGPNKTSYPLLAAGILGLTGVALGALGAHALKATLIERGMTAAWDSAARYHLFQAIALLALAAWERANTAAGTPRSVRWITHLWCAGVVLFSGSIYWLALGGPRWLGPVTPIGGVALMVGWLLAMIAAFPRRS